MKTEEILAATNGGLEVYQHYVGYLEATGPLRLGKHYKSPMGHTGRASFDLFAHRDEGLDRICFKDHGINGAGNDCFVFVQRLFNCEFAQAIDMICLDVLNLTQQEHRQRSSAPRPERVIYAPLPKLTDVPHVTLLPELRGWDRDDERFFARNGTRIETVEKYDGRAIQYYDLRKPDKSTRIYQGVNDPVYGYYFRQTAHWKIYRPESARFKWISNLDARKDIFGLHLLPDECDVIILAAGNRDTMALHELTGLPVIALASESAKLTPELALLLRSIARVGVYSVMDTDAAGVRAQDQLLLDFGIKPANEMLKTLHPRYQSKGEMYNDVSQALEVMLKANDTRGIEALRRTWCHLADR